MPNSREGETRPAAGREKLVNAQKSTFHIYTYNTPLRDVVELESRGCRKLKRGNTAVPMYLSLCEVRCCCTAAVGVSVYCAGAFEIQKICRLQLCRLCSGWRTGAHAWVYTQSHRSWPLQRDDLDVRLPWLTRRINSLEHGLIHRHTAAADSTAQKSGIDCTALCCVPTVVPCTIVPTPY